MADPKIFAKGGATVAASLLVSEGIKELMKSTAVKTLAASLAKSYLPKNVSAKMFPRKFLDADAAKKVLYAGAGVGLAGTAGVAAGEKIKQNQDIKKSLEHLKKKHPQLKDRNAKQVGEYFGVVKKFSPSAASNPLVAGSLVNKMFEFGGVDHKLVQDIANIESKRDSVFGSTGPKVLESAAKSLITGVTE